MQEERKKIFIESLELSRKVQAKELTSEEAENQFKTMLHKALSDKIIEKSEFDAVTLFLFSLRGESLNDTK